MAYEPTNITLEEMCRRMSKAGFKQSTIDSFVEDVRRLPLVADRRADPEGVEVRRVSERPSLPLFDHDPKEAA